MTTAKQSYRLQEVLIVGNKQDQLKFSELTVDMFRMVQTFERNLDERCPAEQGDDKDANDDIKNPHKYLLYRATIEQILANLNSAWSELSWNGVLLLYISSDPCSNNHGFATVSRLNRTKIFDAKQSSEDCKEIHWYFLQIMTIATKKIHLL